MLFKNPTVLYALFALLIPILIHLFKLRKFQKTAFTNVAFLEKIKLQTRKSSQLKKWLVLLSRLFLLASIILAFAEPYLPAKNALGAPPHYIIYLDNSFSMQAKGSKGVLLQRGVQELISSIDPDQTISLFTNDEVYENIIFNEITNDLLDLDFTYEQLSAEQLQLKFKQLAKGKTSVQFIALSDFQVQNGTDYTKLIGDSMQLIQLNPENTANVAIDSLWVSSKANTSLLHIKTSATNFKNSLPLSITNDEALIGKASLDFTNQNTQVIEVPLPSNETIAGTVQLQDGHLAYDNTRYFSLNKELPRNISVISDVDVGFLKRIFTENEFDFKRYTLASINYAELSETDMLIINEAPSLPAALLESLKNLVANGVLVCIIPSAEATSTYQQLAASLNLSLGDYGITGKKLTNISYLHPLYQNVFTKQIENFQYPKVRKSFTVTGGQVALKLEDGSPFLTSRDNIYLFAAPLNAENTNFKQSPLIVPTFYNMAKQNLSVGNIEYRVGVPQTIVIKTSQESQDDVLEVTNTEEQFIPLQQIFKNKVQLTTGELPTQAGNFEVISNQKPIYQLSFNYGNKESKLAYTIFDSATVLDSATSFFSSTKAGFKITELWKWFLIFALAFIGIEILLLKFLK